HQTAGETESEKLSHLRPRHRALRLVDLELESLPDESRDALHHPLTRSFAVNVDVAIVRVSNKAMSTPLQLPVQFVEHEVAEQGESGPPCGVPSTLGLTNPFSITPAFKNARMSFNSRLSRTRLAICPINLSWLTRSKNFSKSRSTTQPQPPAIYCCAWATA